MANADMFLKLTKIKGESLDAKHPGEIEVLSWSFGAFAGGYCPSRQRIGNRQGQNTGSHDHALRRQVIDRSFEASDERQAHR